MSTMITDHIDRHSHPTDRVLEVDVKIRDRIETLRQMKREADDEMRVAADALTTAKRRYEAARFQCDSAERHLNGIRQALREIEPPQFPSFGELADGSWEGA